MYGSKEVTEIARDLVCVQGVRELVADNKIYGDIDEYQTKTLMLVFRKNGVLRTGQAVERGESCLLNA